MAQMKGNVKDPFSDAIDSVLATREKWDHIEKLLNVAMSQVITVRYLQSAGNMQQSLAKAKEQRDEWVADFKGKLQIAEMLITDLTQQEMEKLNLEVGRYTESIVKKRAELTEEWRRLKLHRFIESQGN